MDYSKGRPITKEEVYKLERLNNISFMALKDKEFIENFRNRFIIYGQKTNITQSQVEWLADIWDYWESFITKNYP